MFREFHSLIVLKEILKTNSLKLRSILIDHMDEYLIAMTEEEFVDYSSMFKRAWNNCVGRNKWNIPILILIF